MAEKETELAGKPCSHKKIASTKLPIGERNIYTKCGKFFIMNP
jgi:hypothetical protein